MEMKERVDRIVEIANSYFEWSMYRDLACDELMIDPSRTDDKIGHEIAMKAAFQ